MSTSAQHYLQRSPLYRLHKNAEWFEHGNSLNVSQYSNDDRAQSQSCALADLSNIARAGFRGAAAATYLQQLGYQLPEQPNRALAQADSSAVLRLSATEYLILGALADAGSSIEQQALSWRYDGTANYLLPRQDSHAWLLLSGEHKAHVMAKLCGVDLSTDAFALGQVVQTSAARINVIVAHLLVGEQPCFHILCDRSSSQYLWQVLLDAMHEFSGKAVGLKAFL